MIPGIVAAGSLVPDYIGGVRYTQNSVYPRQLTTNVDLSSGGLLFLYTSGGQNTELVFKTGGSTYGCAFFSSPTADTGAITNLTFNTTGWTFDNNTAPKNTIGNTDLSAVTCVGHTMKSLSGLLDVVNYTGDGAASKLISHGLGAVPGAILIKRVDGNSNGQFGHRQLNGGTTPWNYRDRAASTVGYAADTSAWNDTAPSSTQFTVGNSADCNANGASYVAFVFGHDTGGSGTIQCDSYTGNGSATGPSVSLGWNPRILLIKAVSGSTHSWIFLSQFMTSGFSGNDLEKDVSPSNAENTGTDYVGITGSGFQINTTNAGVNSNGVAYHFIAIK